MSAMAWSLSINSRAGEPIATVRWSDGAPVVEPPGALADPFVAAALAELTRSAGRPRLRPACVSERPRPR